MSTIVKKESTETLLKWIGALVAVGGLLWGVTSFLITSRIQAETRHLEARKPYLERQLTLYTEATQSAAILATSSDPDIIEKARQRFWELYWGELAMVENGGLNAIEGGVEAAMVMFGECLNRGCSQSELQPLALRLAHACRDSLAASWDVQDWSVPTYTK
jgi:hypothetical protein